MLCQTKNLKQQTIETVIVTTKKRDFNSSIAKPQNLLHK